MFLLLSFLSLSLDFISYFFLSFLFTVFLRFFCFLLLVTFARASSEPMLVPLCVLPIFASSWLRTWPLSRMLSWLLEVADTGCVLDRVICWMVVVHLLASRAPCTPLGKSLPMLHPPWQVPPRAAALCFLRRARARAVMDCVLRRGFGCLRVEELQQRDRLIRILALARVWSLVLSRCFARSADV